jgi:uncharacterized membrane protein YccF (DUF307 family)
MIGFARAQPILGVLKLAGIALWPIGKVIVPA